MSFATIDDLRSQLGKPAVSSAVSQAYADKMLHPIPEAPSVDRAAFLLERVKGKRVLEFGATGPMHEAIVAAAAEVFGVDREDGPGVIGWDLDDVGSTLPHAPGAFDVIVCGELVEHLGNPQWFLTRLRRQYAGVPVILTTPNAFSRVAARHLAGGLENVNRDHVAWYSFKTLHVLVERAGYAVHEFYWYGGPGPTAQGLIVVME